MDRVPLITPALVKAVSSKTDNSSRVLTAEVVSSTPVSDKSNQSGQQYQVVLQMAQQGSKQPHKITTISHHNLQPGSQIEVKVLPGPELKIINADKAAQAANNQTANHSATSAAQRLLADRTPNLQQQDVANLIKQLAQQLSQSNLTPKNPLMAANPAAQNGPLTEGFIAAHAGNKLYQSLQAQTQAIAENNRPQQNISSAELLNSVKNWLQNLPKSHDISSATGLKNALNNAGLASESQLKNLAQQSMNIPARSANSIFQQLQSASAQFAAATDNKATGSNTSSLSQLVKNTAKALNEGSQKIFNSFANPTQNPTSNPTANNAFSMASHWQNPLLNNQQYSSLEGLLQDPLLQNPSSNTKFALSQILAHSLQSQTQAPSIPLNWPERFGSDAALLRSLQNLLGHIEREQLQQLQSNDVNQAINNPSAQTALQQQWLPLLFLHQQQLQLIEFFIDKEEKENSVGEKKNHWFINLHFELPTLGAMGIEIAMFENECSTTFWSESAATLSQISQRIQPLRERLSEQGIIVSDIQSRFGTLVKRKHNIQQRLVDIST